MAGRPQLCQDDLGWCSVARIDKHAELLRSRQQLAQKPYPLAHRSRRQIVEAGCIAARPSQTGDKPKRHRVFGNPEDNGDPGSCVLGRARPRLGARRGDDVNIATNEVGREFRKQIELAFGPAIFDGDVTTLNKTRFCQTLAEGINTAVAGTAGRHGAEEADHWQRWLLRTRRERPRGCAAKRVDKFSSPDTDCHATLQRVMQRRERYHTRTCCAAGIRSGLCLLWVQKRESALFSLVSASTGCGYAAA